MTAFEILSEEELALVVGGFNADAELRRRTGMCGCGVLPGGDLHAAH